MSSTKGLTSLQAQQLLAEFGPNELPLEKSSSTFQLLFKQINNGLNYLLGGAIILSFLIDDVVDGGLIALVLLLNIALGFWQEYKASRELEALKKFQVEYSRVIRDGKEVQILSTELVPGDVVLLEAGDKIPSDGEILESFSMQVDESVLTGESLPVIKSVKKNENNLFFGTVVLSGRGKFKVSLTGVNTRFGKIAQTLSSVTEAKTPLEKTLSSLSKGVAIAAILIAGFIFFLSILRGFEIYSSFLTSIALMVAAVPEGLPAVVTIVLALGVSRMYRKKALVRKMIAVESLGAATVICTDKTGTLTKNEMRVKEVKAMDHREKELLQCAVICNSASLVLKKNGGGFDILGDTTEGALLLWGQERRMNIDLERSQGKLLEEVPFSLQTRKMTVFWQRQGKKIAYTKGAPEVILGEVKLSVEQKRNWDREYQRMAKKGLRVLGFSANRQFLGLVGIADEVRPEVFGAIALTRQAGIKVVMVTGDNELTAKAVGEEVGLLREGEEVLTGQILKELSDQQLRERVGKVAIFARITPEDKLRIVKIYQALGEVVAVTGDGVNDALALKQAEVGVSMGKIGTDVSKEASDIILLDDNFATLVTAVEQGRLIYNNILKVVKFLLAGNLSEILLIGLAVAFGMPSPLLPTQILWINFVTDGLPALALGFDSASGNLMKSPPRSGSNVLGVSMMKLIVSGGLVIAVLCLLVFYFTNLYFGLDSARASVFTTLVVLQMILPFIIRRHHGVFSNKKLLGSVIFVLVMQFLILTVPLLQKLFKI